MGARVLLLALTACGRLGFDLAPGDAVGPDPDAALDGDLTDPTLLLWFEMETEPMGQVLVLDSSRNGFHGACSGSSCPSITPGVRGNAYEFDGINDLVRITSRPELQVFTATLALWVRLGTAPQPGLFFVAFGKPYDSLTDLNSFQIWIDDSPSFGAGGHSVAWSYEMAPAEIGVWTHVALVWDAGTTWFYKDGALVGSRPMALTYDDQDLVIGADLDFGSSTARLRGAIDDLRFYSRVLTEAELALLATP